MDEMTQITDSILSNDTVEVERLTAVFLSESFDTPMFSWEWRDNPKREAILIGLTFMHTKPDAVNLDDKTEIFRFMGDTSTFVEYIKYIETSEGITGWVRLFNEMAQEHYLETDTPDTLIGGYNEFLQANDIMHPITEAMKNLFPKILEKTSMDVSIIDETDEFSEDFRNDWV